MPNCEHRRPHGKLKISVKATWLKDAKIDADAMTEMSGPSMFSAGKSHRSGDEEEDEQVRCKTKSDRVVANYCMAIADCEYAVFIALIASKVVFHC